MLVNLEPEWSLVMGHTDVIPRVDSCVVPQGPPWMIDDGVTRQIHPTQER